MTSAIYARYSSDLQSERSIDDQMALARAYAAREGLAVSHTYEDRAMSGASMQQRHGLQQLLAAAASGAFKCLIVESLDRLSRDQADMAQLYKRLSFHGVEIREVHGGIATPINAAVRGLMGTLFLSDLAHKVHRGLSGNIREGKSAGGRAYGYRPVKGEAGRLEIVEHEAEIVRRIFKAYADGQSPRAIASALNADSITPIMGQRWNASTIQGRKDRGSGVLGNSLYRGIMTWNKVKMLKHPDTGRRISRANPPAEWQTHEVPELRIIDEDVWTIAQSRRRVYDPRGNSTRVRKHLLSGLLRCHCCGGTLVVKDRQSGHVRLQCATRKESGACANTRIYNMQRIEAAVLALLKAELSHPALIEAYVSEYNAERQRLAAAATNARASLERRKTQVTGELERTVTLMIKGLVDPLRHAARVKELELEERELMIQLSAHATADVITLHPAAITRYRQQLDELQTTLTAGTPAADALRTLVSHITVRPDYTFDIEGRLSELINHPAYPTLKGVAVVARARVGQEPTFRLFGKAA